MNRKRLSFMLISVICGLLLTGGGAAAARGAAGLAVPAALNRYDSEGAVKMRMKMVLPA